MARAASAVTSLCLVWGLAEVAKSGPSPQTKITVWGAPPSSAAFGGMTYGGFVPLVGAMVTEQREVDVAATGEVRVTGIASTIEPASVQLRDLTEPAAAITEQRFTPGATTPLEILARHVGNPVTVITTKGDVAGVLRAVDEASLVLELGSGDQRRLSVMRRDGYVLDVRTPGGADKPSLAWRIATKKPGKHTVELTYRAENITWTADYLAVLDEAGRALDFTAWATIKNHTGATFERADVTLVSGGGALSGIAASNAAIRSPPVPLRFAIGSPVKLGAGDAVQVELVPSRAGAKVRPVVTYEATADLSANQQEEANQDCTFNSGGGQGRAELAIELDLPAGTTLPDGRVRVFRRKAGRLEVVSEDAMRSLAGLARIKLAADGEITGERKAVTCTVDERAHTLVEKVEVRVENKGKRAADVVVREFAWRWPVWRLESEDRRSVRAGPQTLEYRLAVPAKGAQTVSYTVIYTW